MFLSVSFVHGTMLLLIVAVRYTILYEITFMSLAPIYTNYKIHQGCHRLLLNRLLNKPLGSLLI